MAGKISTHVLDTSIGKPGAGVVLRLYAIDSMATSTGDALKRTLLIATQTNADGRTDAPLLANEAMRVGQYEIEFEIGAYFKAQGKVLPEPAFLDMVTLRFGVVDAAANYHVPLVCTPWSYSTYRGS